MAADRPFPPTARRQALARAAGLTPASPIVVGALACASAVVALAVAGSAIAQRLGASLHAALTAAGNANGIAMLTGASANGIGTRPDASDANIGAAGTALSAPGVVTTVVALALPVLGALALAALLAHLAQTRAVWLPRRRIPNAPAEDPQRATRGALAIGNAVTIGLVTVGWLYAMAPRLGALASVADLARAGALLVLSFLAALAIAWVALGAVDAVVRHAAHAHALRMTPAEQREDQRLAGADPRWRARREKLARGEPVRDAIAGASVLLLGDGVAVAVAWDPQRRPVPTRTASGRAARATQLLGLARRHAIAVHRDAELATLLATGEGPVPEAHWARLAEIIAATSRR